MEYSLGEVKNTTGAIGLMFKLKCPEKPTFIPLPTYDKTIHTWFMFFDIDVFFVDKDGVVIDGTAMKPWQAYNPVSFLDGGVSVKDSDKIVGAIETRHNQFKDVTFGDKLKFVLV